ncbi:MAG: AtpZ/AtpI family protein [Alphaproteobacteria bacterium]
MRRSSIRNWTLRKFVKKEPEELSEEQDNFVATSFNVAYTLFVHVCVFSLIGVFVDKKYETTPLFSISFFVLGCMTASWSAYKVYKGK